MCLERKSQLGSLAVYFLTTLSGSQVNAGSTFTHMTPPSRLSCKLNCSTEIGVFETKFVFSVPDIMPMQDLLGRNEQWTP